MLGTMLHNSRVLGTAIRFMKRGAMHLPGYTSAYTNGDPVKIELRCGMEGAGFAVHKNVVLCPKYPIHDISRTDHDNLRRCRKRMAQR